MTYDSNNYATELARYADTDIIHDYLVMLEDFGATDKDVIQYKAELDRRGINPLEWHVVRYPITGRTYAIERPPAFANDADICTCDTCNLTDGAVLCGRRRANVAGWDLQRIARRIPNADLKEACLQLDGLDCSHGLMFECSRRRALGFGHTPPLFPERDTSRNGWKSYPTDIDIFRNDFELCAI